MRIPDIGDKPVFPAVPEIPLTDNKKADNPNPPDGGDKPPSPTDNGDGQKAVQTPSGNGSPAHARPDEAKAAPAEPKPEQKPVAPPPPAITEEEKARLRQEVIDAAEAEAEQLKKQAYDTAYEEAYNKGYGEGRDEALRRARDEINGSLSEMQSDIAAMRDLQAEYFETYSDKLSEFACEIAGKILTEQIERDELVLRPLVNSIIERMKGAPWINIEISSKLEKLADALKTDLAGTDNVEITPAAGEEGLLRISTETGAVDASISTQLENLRRVFYVE